MTESANLFKEVKLVTRSLLLSAPKGLTVRSFVSDYRLHNGQDFPFRDLGYSSAIDLIRDLPDAVRMEWLPSIGDYMLRGIADDSTKHIENLVKKQRKSRTGYPPPPRFQKLHNLSRSYNNESTSYGKRTVNQVALKRATRHHLSGLVPAKLRSQIRQLLASYEDGLLISNFRIAFKKHFGIDFPIITLGFSSLENCLRHVPEIALLRYSDSLLKVYPAKRKDSEVGMTPLSTSAILPDERFIREIEQPNKHEINGAFDFKSFSQSHMDALDGFDSPEHSRAKYNTQRDDIISRTQYGALDNTFTVKTEPDILDDTFPSKVQHNTVEDTFISRTQHNNVEHTFISRMQHNISKDTFTSETSHNTPELSSSRTEPNRQEDTSTLVTAHNTPSDDGISERMKKDFRRVLELYSEGIWATEFLDKYTAITRQKLDISELGYLSLIELVSALPDIFFICRPDNRKDDWLLFDVNNPEVKVIESNCAKGAASVSLNSSACDEEPEINETLKNNVLSILKHCCKDIALEEFAKIYKANFNMDLPWATLGFDSVEAFMVVLSGDIPLNLRNVNGKFYVTLQSEVPKYQMSPSMFVDLKKSDSTSIPNDSALPGCSFQTQALPEDISKYIGIFVSTVDHPGLVWIQIRGETTTIALEVLMENLEKVYYGSDGDNYKMPESFVEVGQVCAVVWPGDDNWHRALITGIPSKEFAEVFYIDYGSRGNVRKSGLRLLKKEFLGLPAQAIKARLAHILPAVGKRWSDKSKQVLLNLCSDRPLAALITNTEYDEKLSICLCDVSGDNDFHINDYLVREGYAKPFKDPYNIDCNEEDVKRLTLSPPANQAQQNDMNKIALALATYQNLTGMVNMVAARLISQLSGSGINVDSLPQLLSSCALSPNSNRTTYTENISPPCTLPANSIRTTYTQDIIPPSTSNSSIQNERSIIEEPKEIFEEGDEFYEQLCQSAEELKISIKRVPLVGGHVIHIIDSNHKPFVSSGDISSLFGKSVCLEKLLMMKKILIPSVTLEKSDNEEIFQDLKRYDIKGIKNEKEGTATITLYPLQSVMEILEGLSHPSEILRKEVANIITEVNNRDDFWQDNGIAEDLHLTSQTANLERMSIQEISTVYEDQCKRRNEIIQKMTDPIGPKDYHVEELRCIENNLIKLDARMKEIENARGNEMKNKHTTLQEIQDLPNIAFRQQSSNVYNSQNSLVSGENSEELHRTSNAVPERNQISPHNIGSISPSLSQKEASKDFKLFRGENTATQLQPQKSSLQYTSKNSGCNNTINDISSQVCNTSMRDSYTDNAEAIAEQPVSYCYTEQAASKNIPFTQGKISPVVPSKPSIRFSSQIFAPRNCSPSSPLIFPLRPTGVQPRYTWNSSKSTS